MDCTQEHSEEVKMENMILCVGTKKIVEKWLEDFIRGSRNYYYCEMDKEGHERLHLFTHNTKYQINFSKTYLGASYENRAARPGEDWLRGGDLPDGRFNHSTFLKIMGSILQRELEIVPVQDRGYENVKTFSISATVGDKNSLPPGTRSFAYGMKKNQMLTALKEANEFLARDKQLQEEHVNNS